MPGRCSRLTRGPALDSASAEGKLLSAGPAMVPHWAGCLPDTGSADGDRTALW